VTTQRPRRTTAYYARWQLLCRTCWLRNWGLMPAQIKRGEAMAAAQEHADHTGHEVVVTHRREWTIRRKERNA